MINREAGLKLLRSLVEDWDNAGLYRVSFVKFLVEKLEEAGYIELVIEGDKLILRIKED